MIANRLFMKLALSLIFISLASEAFARTPPSTSRFPTAENKAGKSYASFDVALNEFRSVALYLSKTTRANGFLEEDGNLDVFFPLTAQTYAVKTSLGTYITDHFRTELRAGAGFHSDTLKQTLEINLKHWVSWYIGATHPITDYFSAYALYGISFYSADVTRYEIEYQSTDGDGITSTSPAIASSIDMEKDLFGTSFSTSWMLGGDFTLAKDLFLTFEYGRLLKDTDSNIKVYQGSTGIRYEF